MRVDDLELVALKFDEAPAQVVQYIGHHFVQLLYVAGYSGANHLVYPFGGRYVVYQVAERWVLLYLGKVLYLQPEFCVTVIKHQFVPGFGGIAVNNFAIAKFNGWFAHYH